MKNFLYFYIKIFLYKSIKIYLYLVLCCFSCSCGSPRTAIRVVNKADGTQTDISIKQGDGGSTSVEVVPTASLAVDTVRFATNPVGHP